jgi:hypothetical protein
MGPVPDDGDRLHAISAAYGRGAYRAESINRLTRVRIDLKNISTNAKLGVK